MTVRFELAGEVEGRWDVDLRPDGVRVNLGGRARRADYGSGWTHAGWPR